MFSKMILIYLIIIVVQAITGLSTADNPDSFHPDDGFFEDFIYFFKSIAKEEHYRQDSRKVFGSFFEKASNLMKQLRIDMEEIFSENDNVGDTGLETEVTRIGTEVTRIGTEVTRIGTEMSNLIKELRNAKTFAEFQAIIQIPKDQGLYGTKQDPKEPCESLDKSKARDI